MLDESYARGASWIHRLDPRGRLLATAAFAGLLGLAHRPAVLTAGLLLAVGLVALARLPVERIGDQTLGLVVALASFWLLLPISFEPAARCHLGPIGWEPARLARSAEITLKALGLVLLLHALVRTIDMVTLGHALRRLGVPLKLTLLLLLTVRYVGVLESEYYRLRRSLRARSFRPALAVHTYRTLGYLFGLLLVRSLDRAERIVMAMKCRGFHGEFFLLDDFGAGRPDIIFGCGCTAAWLTLAWMEWA